MNLEEQIKSLIDKVVMEFIGKVVSKYDSDVDMEELVSLWNETTKIQPKVPLFSKRSNSESSSETCPYPFSKGDKKGQLCGAKVKPGCTHCTVHKKFEGKVAKEQKVLPAPKRGALLLPKHKELDVYYHKESGLVFKSDSERVVTGRIKGNKIVPLKESDIETCKKYKFRFEKEDAENEAEDENEGTEQEESVFLTNEGKFWNATLSGNNMTATYGKHGSEGRSTPKTFATPEKALKEFKKLVAEKKRKGYEEVAQTPKSQKPKKSVEPPPAPKKSKSKSKEPKYDSDDGELELAHTLVNKSLGLNSDSDSDSD